MRLQTQWRISPTGHRIGLDYRAVPVVCRALGVKFAEVFSDLQVMEVAAINESLKNGNR